MEGDITKFEYKGFKVRIGADKTDEGEFRPRAMLWYYINGELGTEVLYGQVSFNSQGEALEEARRWSHHWIDRNPRAKPHKEFPPPLTGVKT